MNEQEKDGKKNVLHINWNSAYKTGKIFGEQE